MIRKPINIIFPVIAILLFSCKKEYSYEGGPVIIIDTGTTNIPKPYICPSCTGGDQFIESKWSFYNGNDFYCGGIDTAIAAPARNGFTFFGPSSCSIDSGLVMTINTEPALLNQDVFNSTTTKVGMYYYDNTVQTYPFITQPGFQFSVTIESYIYQTRVMTGTFNGIVVRPNGGQTGLQGKFKVKVF
jgi:hypothetical protein